MGGPINEGSPNVDTNGQPQARVTDRTRCTGAGVNDLILMGSATVEINGLPAARKTDQTTHGGQISEGSDNVEIGGASVRATVQQLAALVKRNSRITLAQNHVSGVRDNANAQQNIDDAAAGNQAHRSNYENAPGGTTNLNRDALTTLNDYAKDHDVTVSELAGGSHSANSRHYSGLGWDVTSIDGTPISARNPGTGLMDAARAGGATEVLGPGSPGHAGHIHAAWPR
ncbi:putative carboxypeptidase [Minicystis rosea]|nr:putative carboxypeptidase [Minicystis rosea]